jgi:hypothetical protein
MEAGPCALFLCDINIISDSSKKCIAHGSCDMDKCSSPMVQSSDPSSIPHQSFIDGKPLDRFLRGISSMGSEQLH